MNGNKDESSTSNNAFSVLMSSASKSNWKRKSVKKANDGPSSNSRSGSITRTVKKKQLLPSKKKSSTAAINTPRKLTFENSSSNEKQHCSESSLLLTHVTCPICEERIKTTLINDHLDLKCTAVKKKSDDDGEIVSKKRPLSMSTLTDHRSDEEAVNKQCSSTEQHSNKKAAIAKNPTTSCSITPLKTPTKLPTAESDNDKHNSDSAINTRMDVFAHMMNHARRLSTKSKPKTFIFHLHDDQNGMVSWSDANNNSEQSNALKRCEKWRSSVYIKGSEDGMRHELIISSSIPSAADECLPDHEGIYKLKPLVKKHSKLSVPVLKSCLQKAIRRKRPLPAVRTAMELMDKSLESFLRRLPIIILEDSTLHPDYPLIVWLMIAVSKDFLPTKKLTIKLMKIVFEVAFCSWKDDVIDAEVEETWKSEQEVDVSLDDQDSSIGEKEALLLRSMILRRQYGGMQCDKDMLKRFVHRWQQRFLQCHVKQEMAQRCFETKEDIKWIQVPYLCHTKCLVSSSNCVPPLIDGDKLVSSLTKSDITAAGIDFHCTNVLDFVLQTNDVYTKIRAKIFADGDFDGKNVTESIDGSTTKKKLLDKLKGFMWRFSAGINLRRSLAGSEREDIKEVPLYNLWIKEIQPHVDAFVAKYTNDRLVDV